MIRTPTWLGKKAQKKWHELRKQLPNISDRDADALALLCDSWQRYLDTAEIIDREGYNLKSENGRMFVNPAINVRNEAWKQIVKLSKAFGLMPDADSGDSVEDFSPFKRILEHRAQKNG